MEAASERICLVVDDEESIRAFLKAILNAHGFHILEAADGTQALRLVHKLNGALDVVISDITMPGDMDGLDLAHAVRNAFPAIHVILISGTPEQEQRSLRQFRLVRKPFRAEAILAALAEEGFSVKRRTDSG